MSRQRLLHTLLLITLLLGACQPAPAAPAIFFMVFGDPAELAAYQNLAAAYEANFAPAKVQLIHIPSQAAYRARLAADFAAGSPADVTLINYRRYASLAAQNALEPLGPYLEKSQVIQASDFYPESITPFYWRGQLYCIPQNLSSLVVYYNKDLFDQAGLPYPPDDWNWDEFLAAAQALTRDLDGDGRADQHGLGTEASIFRLAPFVWQAGADIVDNPNLPTRLTLDRSPALDAMRWFVELQTVHHVTPNQAEEISEDSESRFMHGRLAMFLNSRRGTPTYRTISAFDWDVAPLPRGQQAAGILHADAYCLSSAAKNKPLAWQFIEYANSVAGQTIIAASGRTVPSLRAVAESPAFLDSQAKPARSNVFLDTIPYLRAVPITETWVDIETVVSEELERAFYGLASVEEAARAAAQRAQPFFNKK